MRGRRSEMKMDSGRYIGPYVLDWAKLQPCDIILSRWRKSMENAGAPSFGDRVVSGVIRPFSSGYSHAMLYFDRSIIHAHDPFVFSDNPQRVSVANSDDLVCLRCLELSDEQKKCIELFARGRSGAIYSKLEAAKTVLMKWFRKFIDISGEEFCSRLVAEAYQCAGIQLVKNFSYCAPGDFLHSPCLKNMGVCTRPTTEDDRKRLATEDMVHKSQCNTKKWLLEVRSLAKRDNFQIEAINSIFEYVLKFPKRDGEVFNALKESGYLETWKDDKAAHGYRYDPVAMQIICQNQPDDFKNEVMCLFDCAGRYGGELVKLNQIKGGVKTINAVADLYQTMIQDIHSRLILVIMQYVNKPGVGPLVRLRTMCIHLVGGTYSQYYSLTAREEAAKQSADWKREVGLNH